MATTTTYYGMSKPTLLEAADIRVINGDIDTIDRVMHSHMVSMAPVFDPASTYDVGDFVMYNDILYRCKTAISTAAAWDATKWDATNIVDEFPEGGSGGVDYSTTEQIIGMWLGEPLYRKVVYIGELTYINDYNPWTSVAHNISNVKTFINIRGFFKGTNDGRIYNIPHYRVGGSTGVSIGADATNIYYINNWIQLTEGAYVILEYTKTSS